MNYQIAQSITTQEISLKRDENLTYIVILTKGSPETKSLKFNLEGENSSLKCIVINIGKNDEEFNFEIIPNHIGKHTSSNVIVKSALFDNSKTKFIGTIDIENNAIGTTSYLTHNTLLLSENASVRTDPCLEIEQDDVKAGHAATVGKVDENMLFYMQSRGLSKNEASQIIVKGFLEKEILQIENEEKKNEVLQIIEDKLIIL